LLLENLRLSIAQQQLQVDGQTIRVTISLGARYVSPDEDEDLTSQMCDADTALYNAKHSGRNCLMWF
jgi:diguanylate cyclase (GGDEF)-like protein